MAFNFKLPGKLIGKKATSVPTAKSPALSGEEAPSKTGRKPGHTEGHGVIGKIKMLSFFLLALLVAMVSYIYYDSQQRADITVYVAAAGEMGMLSQRLTRTSTQAARGAPEAFKQAQQAYARFSELLERLVSGGEIFGRSVPASPEGVQPTLQKISNTWKKTSTNVQQLLRMEKSLVNFGKRAELINEGNALFLDVTEQVATLKFRSGENTKGLAPASQMVMLTQRIAKNVNALQSATEVNPEISFQLGKDIHTYRELLTALTKGNDTLGISAETNPEIKAKLVELEGVFKNYQRAVLDILDDVSNVITAKQADISIFRDSEALLNGTEELAGAYRETLTDRVVFIGILSAMGLLAAVLLGMIIRVYLNDSRRQTETANEKRVEIETNNRKDQDAILRLMNELGDLADGDLTITATVSEDITGAIADSINYTVEELRVLVGRINDAANQVTSATESAQQTSYKLLEAAKRQSQTIRETGSSVLSMARSMIEVSKEADQSAEVARSSLQAAEKGTTAVHDSIGSMNEIRGQIQETSKRIKRLGESSQEIGEIVELISDITEQTNVLALNAAIQAASAGEAGRGFTVVAEEVQRLAERSAEATKQISAIVKTIQTDTQGAVSAMEESTRGVVEGAKLSDAAGQALTEIGDVSQSLAELIQNISTATRKQAEAATSVAGRMQDILQVTEQTTSGTQKTALAVGELSTLAMELKGSVAGFKVD